MKNLFSCLSVGLWLVAATAHGQNEVPDSSDANKRPLAGVRTWTDSTGKYKIQAKLVEVKDGQVTKQYGKS